MQIKNIVSYSVMFVLGQNKVFQNYGNLEK